MKYDIICKSSMAEVKLARITLDKEIFPDPTPEDDECILWAEEFMRDLCKGLSNTRPAPRLTLTFKRIEDPK